MCSNGGGKLSVHFTHILPIQFSCISSSPELSDREKFRYYFQMSATEANLAIGFYGVIKHFGWQKVAFLEQNENVFTEVSYLLVEICHRELLTYRIVRKLIILAKVPPFGCEQILVINSW